jgi:hypothetical protein
MPYLRKGSGVKKRIIGNRVRKRFLSGVWEILRLVSDLRYGWNWPRIEF